MHTQRQRQAHAHATVRRSGLRLADLKARQPMAARLMNVKIPMDVAGTIDLVAATVGASKTEAVIALRKQRLAKTPARLAHALILFLLSLGAGSAQAKTLCMVKVHGKGGYELSDPSGYWAEDYWANGQFQSIAQPCAGMPTLTTHADGTYGQDVAFQRAYCGCGIARWQGCDYLWRPQNGVTDPGINGQWPSSWPNGWASADTNNPINQCVRTGPYWPRQWPVPPQYQGVLEQINAFLDQTGCDDLTIVTHSNGGNVIRYGFSYTQVYTMSPCRQGGSSSGALDPGCVTLRQHQLRVINATTNVITLHAPSTGSEAANLVQTLTSGQYSWATGWIAEWLGTPYDRATQELTSSAMLVRNSNFMYGTRTPLRQWPIATQDGIPLRIARWIAIATGLSTTQMLEDGTHAEDYELLGAAGVVPFAGSNDGLVTFASQAAVYTGNSDIWSATGQHDTAAAATYSGLGNNGNNHHHARLGGAAGGLWRPVYWRWENTTPMTLSWPGPAFPAPGGPGSCSRVRIGTNPDGSTVDAMTCPTWPVPSYFSHGVAVPACPDASCLANQTRGYPAGADVAFWISAFVEARAASWCGPALANSSNIPSGQWINYYRNTLTCGGSLGFGCAYGPTWSLVGQQTIYEGPYAPNAGRQVCAWQC